MSNITLLPKNFKKLIDAKEIFVADFVAFYSNLVHIICGISMLLTLFVTYIIVKKTPSFMSNLKIYLIPYCVYSFVVEMVFATYTPLILHPFAYFYPTGILKNFHPKFAIVVVIFGATAALSLIDCSIGTILERTFALKNIEKLSNGLSNIFIPYLNLTITEKIPFFVFVFLFFTVLCCFLSAILIAFVESFYAYFLVPSDDISNIVNSNIYGLEEYINLNNLLIFQGSEQNTLPISIIFVGIMGWLRATIAAVLIPFNAYKSYKLNILMSAETKKCNSILLKMCYLQFAGFSPHFYINNYFSV